MKLRLALAGFILLTLTFIVFITSTSHRSSPQPNTIAPPYSVATLSQHLTPKSVTIEKEISPNSKIISYSSENLKINALMLIPSGTPPATGWPVIILNHGYIAPTQYSTVDSYKNTATYFASKGFLVLKSDYRGHADSQGVADPALNRLQYAVDVLNLIAALPSLPDIDSHRLYLYGHSMGGEVSLLVAEASPQVKAVSLWAPAVAPFPQDITYFLKRHAITPTDVPVTQTRLNELITQFGSIPFSAYDNVALVSVPLIIQQGTTDESVPFTWGQSLSQHLQTSGKDVTFYSYKGDNHNLSNNWYTALSRDIDFFNSH